MKKSLLLAISASFLIAPFAFAEDFKDLPKDHWAYQAVKKMEARGVMIGYPDKTYRGPQKATRFELGSAVTKVIESLESKKIEVGDYSSDAKKMLDDMKKDMNSQVEALKKDMEKSSEDIKKENASILDKILKSVSKTKITGQFNTGLYVDALSGKKGTEDASELAVRPVLGAKVNISTNLYEEYLTGKMELSTGGVAEPFSSDAIMSDGWAKKAINLNKAYIAWTPNKNWEVGMGKFRSPFHEYETTYDNDVSYEGIYVKPKFDKFSLTAGVFPLKISEKQGMLAGPYLAAGQAGFKADWFDINLGLFAYPHIDSTFSKGINGDGMSLEPIYEQKVDASNNPVMLNGKPVYDLTKPKQDYQYDDKGNIVKDASGKPVYDPKSQYYTPYYGFNVANLGMCFHFQLGLPVSLHINALKNFGVFDNFDFGLPTAGFEKDDKGVIKRDDNGRYVPNKGNTLALMAGVGVGDLEKNKFTVGLDYGMIGSDATVGAYNASTPRLGLNNLNVSYTNLGTNVNYINPYLTIGLADNVTLDANVYFVKKLEDTINNGNDNPGIISSALGVGVKF